MKYIASILLCLIPASLFAQEEVTVTEVMVWVKATDRSGKPIAGLAQSDFEIYEDGKKMLATCFEETTFSTAALLDETQTESPQTAESGGPSIETMKRVAVIIDLFNTQQAEYLYIKPRILEFFQELPTGWEIMLATLIPGAVEESVPFTKDIAAITVQLDRITANAERDLQILTRRRNISQILTQGPRAVGRAYALAEVYADEEKQLARESLKAFGRLEQDLVRWQSDSHMVVLYISGGINSEPGKQYFDLIERTIGSDRALDSLVVRESGSDLRSLLRKIVAQLNRHNITIYTINTRGLESPAPDSTIEGGRPARKLDSAYLDDVQELMAEIADGTGGLYFENSTNFRRGFDLVLSDLNHQYLLCYKAPPHKKPGEFHKIKVETKKSGVKLRHREVYVD